MKRLTALSVLGLLSLVLIVGSAIAQDDTPQELEVSEESQQCIDCHSGDGGAAATVLQWRASRHAQEGVGCYECHMATESRPDSFMHEGQRIITIVTPLDCGECHETESTEFLASRHSEAASFVGSLDNMLGEVVEGTAAATSGCQQCHGSTVAVRDDGSLDPSTWPNSGIGRVNPDGSAGACSACHTRHTFDIAQVRSPENCGRCHMGPDHPQLEIYNESKHGIAFAAWRNSGDMNLSGQPWVVGQDYYQAPTCATCHMSATPNQPITHDIGARISWTLRPVVSTHVENWEANRTSMQDVCAQCHAPSFYEGFYTQFDEAVELYNNKFAIPARDIMTALRERGLITTTPFDDELEWIFFELWHHEGRRARMGASMMGPDYTQWHGFYEVAKNFYLEFLPEVRHLGGGDLVDAVLATEEHRWIQGLTQEQIEQQIRFYRERYGVGEEE